MSRSDADAKREARRSKWLSATAGQIPGRVMSHKAQTERMFSGSAPVADLRRQCARTPSAIATSYILP
jgi:hypothetical protein